MIINISETAETNKNAYTDKKSLFNLIFDCFFTLIISIGIGVIVNLLFPFEAPFSQIAWHMTAAVILIAILTRKYYIIPLILVITGTVGVFVLWIFNSLSSFIYYCIGFFKWWIALFPEDSIYNNFYSISFIQIIIQSGIVFSVFLFIRLVKTILPILIGTVSLIVAAVLQDYNNNELGILFIFAGIIPLLARNAYIDYRLIPRRKFKNINILRSPFWVQAVSLIVCVLCIVSSISIIPKDASQLSSAFTENIAADFQNTTGIYSYSQKYFGKYSLSSIGLQMDSSALGGDIDLSSNAKILRVYSKRKILLKAYTYSDYDGKTWSNDLNKSYRINNKNNLNEQNIAFSNNINKSAEAAGYFNQLTKNDDITIVNLRSLSILFTSGQMSFFYPVTSIKQAIQFNMRSEIFTYKKLPVNFTYKINSLFFTKKSYNELQTINKLETALKDCTDETYDSEGFLDLYTNLPSNFSSKTKNIALAITNSEDTPYGKAALLEAYFKTSGNFTYTTKPGDVPENRELVDYFLQTKKGYCVYFSTAMATMARSLGIPSRMVSGYGMENDGENTWLVKAKFAHSWVECYIKGLGWIPFDPTPSLTYTSYVSTDSEDTNEPEEPYNNTQDNNNTIKNDYPVNAPVTENIPSSVPEVYTENPNNKSGLIFIFPAFLLLIIIICFLQIIRTKNYYNIEYVKKHFNSIQEQAEYYYIDILTMLRLLGYEPFTSETISEFSNRVMNSGLNLAPELLTSFEIISELRYGNIIPEEDDIKTINTAHISLSLILKNNIGKLKYVILRKLLLNTRIQNCFIRIKKPLKHFKTTNK